MANKGLTDAQLTAAADALRQTAGNINAASKLLGYARPTFENHVRTALRKGVISQEELDSLREAAKAARRLPPERESYHEGRRLPQTADEAFAVLDDFIGRKRSLITNTPKKRTARNAEQRRVVVASDLHAPFHDPWAIAEMIRREAPTADVLLIAGDFTDSYSYSQFQKRERVSPEEEWAACDALLEHLSSSFPEVVFIEGNHDERLAKRLRERLDADLWWAVEKLIDGPPDLLRAMAKRYPNVRFTGHQVGRHEAGWFAQYGDVIISHAEKFSRVPGAALRSVEEWFRDQHEVLSLAPWRVLLQAHTHQASAVYWASDKLMLETGCLCTTHGYQLQPKIGGRPQRRGYVTLTQSAEGVTDLNSVRFVWLDPERERVA